MPTQPDPALQDTQAAELKRLQAENENLRGQLAAAGARNTTAAPAAHVFQLSEGQRQELQMHGNAVIDGKMMTIDEVRKILPPGQTTVEITAPKTVRELPAERTRDKIAGIDYIYPSVEYGKLDPAVAGQPGVSGPAADKTGK